MSDSPFTDESCLFINNVQSRLFRTRMDFQFFRKIRIKICAHNQVFRTWTKISNLIWKFERRLDSSDALRSTYRTLIFIRVPGTGYMVISGYTAYTVHVFTGYRVHVFLDLMRVHAVQMCTFKHKVHNIFCFTITNRNYAAPYSFMLEKC